jgi:hypothetical protein
MSSEIKTDGSADTARSSEAGRSGSVRTGTRRPALSGAARRDSAASSQASAPKPIAMFAPAIENGMNSARAVKASWNRRWETGSRITLAVFRMKRSL